MLGMWRNQLASSWIRSLGFKLGTDGALALDGLELLESEAYGGEGHF